MKRIPLMDMSSSSASRTPFRQRVVISALLAVAVFIGIGVGMILSGGASARQERTHHTIQINHVSESPSPMISTALALSEAFAQVAARVEPAVVHIETALEPATAGSDLFDFFHQPNRRRGAGAGVLVDPTGYILTNHHVIDQATMIRVRLYDRRTFTPRVVGVDEETDLAVLKIDDARPFPYATFGDSDALRVGEWVLAIGSPFGLAQTVTAGIISAKDRMTDGPYANFHQFLQTDAAINPGNSGGPLVNLKGEVVGITTQISTRSGVSSGVGFAIPSSMVVQVYNDLITRGKVERGFLGILLDEVKPEVARVYGLDEPRGALIHDVVGEDTPAARAGLRSADIIIEYDGHRVRNQRHLTRLVASTKVGRTVQLKIMRDGREVTIPVTIGARPSAATPRTLPAEDMVHQELPPPRRHHVELGVTLKPVSSELAEALHLDGSQGAMVAEVEEGSLAEELGLRPQDVILRYNRRPITTVQQLEAMLDTLQTGDDVVFEVIGPRRRLNRPGRAVLSLVIP